MASGDKPLAWVTGAGGLIGHYIVQEPSASLPYCPRGLTRTDLDLLDFRAVQQLFQRERPALIIHCAALSKTPACDAEPKLAHQVNVEVTRNLLQLSADIPFLFFSTDLVFDGTKGDYLEEDPPNPLSVYGETKVQAEELVRDHPRHIILRISLTGGRSPTGERAFNEEIAKAWRNGQTLNLFVDEFRSPMAAVVTAKAVWDLVAKSPVGTFHLNGAEKLSRYQIGQLLADRHPELNPKIIPGTRKEYHGPPRPADTTLNCAKVQKHLSFPIPRFSDWLRAHPTAPF